MRFGDIDIEGDIARQQGARKQYHGANVRFFLESVPDEIRSEKEGRPIYFERECIEVHFPGCDRTTRQVTERDKHEYADKYKAFKEGNEQPEEGTPLAQWTMLPRSAADELRYFGVRTVEQLAELNDEQKRKIGTLSPWVKKAKEWLKAANSTQAQVVALNKQLEAANLKLTKQQDQISLLINRIESLEGTRNPLARDIT